MIATNSKPQIASGSIVTRLLLVFRSSFAFTMILTASCAGPAQVATRPPKAGATEPKEPTVEENITACSREDVEACARLGKLKSSYQGMVVPKQFRDADADRRDTRFELTGIGFLPSRRYRAPGSQNIVMKEPEERVAIRDAWSRACESGPADFCFAVGHYLAMKAGEVRNATPFLDRACSKGHQAACVLYSAACGVPKDADVDLFWDCLRSGDCGLFISRNESRLGRDEYEGWLTAATRFPCEFGNLSKACYWSDRIPERARKRRAEIAALLGPVEEKTAPPSAEDQDKARGICNKRCARAANLDRCMSDCMDFCLRGTVGRTQCLGK